MIRPIILTMALCGLAAPVWAEPQPDVQKAAQSVYRLWLGIPLPSGFAKQTDSSAIQALQTQHFAEQVPLTGMSLKQKKSGKIKALSGNGVLFEYAGHQYLLVATGSAYAVSDKGHLVTNAHFVDNTSGAEAVFIDESGLREMGENGGQAETFIVYQKPKDSKLSLFPAKPVARDASSDLAILRVDGLSTSGLKLADGQFAKSADMVFALGMEGERDQLSGESGKIDRVNYIATVSSEGRLDKRIKQKQVDTWLHSAPFSGSVSGGALVNQCGQVLGTNQDGEVNGAFRAISTDELLPLLRKHSIPFQQYQGRCGGVVAKAENIVDGAERVVQSAQHNPRGWLSVLALAVGGLIASVVAWKLLRWAWRQRRVSSALPSSRTATSSTPVRTPVPAQPNTQYAAPRTELASAAISLTALAGSVNAIPLWTQRATTVGRNADNDVVLSHPKISGQHAKFWLNQGVVYVQDLNSTNGTFVNGSPIQSTTALRAGDVVQLTGDEHIARFKLPESHQPASPRTQLHQPSNIAARLQPLDNRLPSIDIPLNGSITIGRASSNDLVLTAMQISGTHCRISADAYGALSIEDLGSSNGTYLDHAQPNQRIKQSSLRIGQRIYLADKNTVYQVVQAN